MVFSWLRRHGLYSSTLGNPPMRVNWSDLFMWLHWRIFTEGIQAVLAGAEGNQKQVEEARKRVCLLSGVCITTWWRACTSAFSQGRLCTQVMSSSNKAVPRCRPVRTRTVVLAHSPTAFAPHEPVITQLPLQAPKGGLSTCSPLRESQVRDYCGICGIKCGRSWGHVGSRG